MRVMCACVYFLSAIVHTHVAMMFRAVDDFVYLVVITSAGNLIPEVAVETDDRKNSPIILCTHVRLHQ